MEMHELLNVWAASGKRGVLATVTEVEGHAYRKCGASMLLLEDGARHGSISPGCLETDLAERVEGILAQRAQVWVEYDMRPEDDLSWGEMIGCGGRIRVLLEPMTGMLGALLLQMKELLDKGEEVQLQRSFENSWTVAGYGLMKSEGVRFREGEVVIAASRLGCTLTTRYGPKPRLLLFGATDDAMPLAELAAMNGFRVMVGDWREGLCTAERFPQAERFIGSPEAWIADVGLREQDYVVAMSHHFQKDQELIRRLLPESLRYLGMMGSVTRTERLLSGERAPAWFHSPVGLQIGAAGPMEIAVSIVAELIRTRRQGMVQRRDARGKQESISHLLGGRSEPADGHIQARHRTRGWRKARRHSP